MKSSVSFWHSFVSPFRRSVDRKDNGATLQGPVVVQRGSDCCYIILLPVNKRGLDKTRLDKKTKTALVLNKRQSRQPHTASLKTDNGYKQREKILFIFIWFRGIHIHQGTLDDLQFFFIPASLYSIAEDPKNPNTAG